MQLSIEVSEFRIASNGEDVTGAADTIADLEVVVAMKVVDVRTMSNAGKERL